MNYKSGEEVMLGDHVSLGGGMRGKLVGLLDAQRFAPELGREEWSYLGTGVLVLSPDAGLVHFPDTIDGVEFIARDGDSLI